MNQCDLHVHSLRSECGFHTLLEIVSIMKGKGAAAFALTDHGPTLGTPLSHFSVLLRRLPGTIDGVRVFKGIESSVLNVEGIIDLPMFEAPYEIVIAGLHPHGDFVRSRGEAENTRALVNAVRRYPMIRGITHPAFLTLPVDHDRLADLAAERNIALEINNSHLRNGKDDIDRVGRLVELALERNVPLMINSDGHVFSEMGEFERAYGLLESHGAERFRIVNRTLSDTLAFLGLEE
jgi:putative hydrolase